MSEDNNKTGPDLEKLEDLINTLRRYPEGIWLRKLSRESSLPVSTVHYYINEVIDPFVESKGAKDGEGRYFGIRLINLKDGIREQLESGKPVEYLLRTRSILTED